MGQEFETQVLEVNPKEIAEKLRNLGAKEEKEYLQKRWVFDIEKTPKNEAWIRLREAKGKAAITYKNKKGTGTSETEEIEFTVENFDKAAEVLSKIKGFSGKYYQENKRHKFVLNEIEFTLDTWPKIPAILEIEAQSEEKVKQGLKLLELEGKEEGHIGLKAIYKKYGIDLHSYKEIKFE